MGNRWLLVVMQEFVRCLAANRELDQSYALGISHMQDLGMYSISTLRFGQIQS